MKRGYAFVDLASGGAVDWAALGISVIDGDRVILVFLRGVKPPFKPSEIVKEFCEVLRAYGCASVVGDRFASGFASEMFAKHGILYEVSKRSKSELFADLLPLIYSGTCELLDIERLTVQLQTLERRTSRGGRDQIAAPPSGFDDLANAAAGALTLPGKSSNPPVLFPPGDAPLSPRSQEVYDQEEERFREGRQQKRERKQAGGDIFQQSLNIKKRGY